MSSSNLLHEAAIMPLRFLQEASAATAEPTVDEVNNPFFSRVPNSEGAAEPSVYYAVAALYGLCACLMLVAWNLDFAEKRRRKERAIVPEESVPCAIAEQYYLDEQFVAMRSSSDFSHRKRRMTFCSFLVHYLKRFPGALSRQHLCLSFMVRAIPTFTRAKRGLLIIFQLHISLAISSLLFNYLEHSEPTGKYEMMACTPESTKDGASCVATLPLAIQAAIAIYPIFRFVGCRQMRFTCFVSQNHPSSSRFPLNVRKFAYIPPKSLKENLLCMRNAYERRQSSVIHSRSLVHRFVHILWNGTQPSIKDLRFYSPLTSWMIFIIMLGFMVFTLIYITSYTAFLESDVVFHWVAFALTMFFFSIFVLEPISIFTTEILWSALVSVIAQNWGFSAHALSASLRYKDVVRQVNHLFFEVVRTVASMRIQRWWRAVLDMYKAIHEQTASAIKIQAMRKKMIQQKKYVKNRMWCMRIDVQGCEQLEEVELGEMMSPFVRLQCDIGNPTIMQTKEAWNAHQNPKFNEHFYVDVKESKAMYVTVWSKDLSREEFVGRGYFEFDDMKMSHKPGGQRLRLPLFNIQIGEKPTEDCKLCGYCLIKVTFEDPLKAQCGDNKWMLPKHRMQFALSKVGGRLRVGQMLGAFGVGKGVSAKQLVGNTDMEAQGGAAPKALGAPPATTASVPKPGPPTGPAAAPPPSGGSAGRAQGPSSTPLPPPPGPPGGVPTGGPGAQHLSATPSGIPPGADPITGLPGMAGDDGA